jgi:hypothetical protein
VSGCIYAMTCVFGYSGKCGVWFLYYVISGMIIIVMLFSFSCAANLTQCIACWASSLLGCGQD